MTEPRFLRSLVVACTLSLATMLSAQSNTPNSTPADSLRVEALKAAPNTASLYEVSFIPRDTLATDAELRLTFPADFDLTELEISGSKDINGGLRLSKNDRQVTVRRSGLGDAIPPGRRVSLKLGLIRNPTNTAATHTVDVVLRASAQKTPAASQRVVVGF